MHTKNLHRSQEIRNSDLYDDLRRVKEKELETQEALSQVAFDARDRATDIIQDTFSDILDKSNDIQDNVVTYVKANPVKAIGFAALAGLILAHLFNK